MRYLDSNKVCTTLFAANSTSILKIILPKVTLLLGSVDLRATEQFRRNGRKKRYTTPPHPTPGHINIVFICQAELAPFFHSDGRFQRYLSVSQDTFISAFGRADPETVAEFVWWCADSREVPRGAQIKVCLYPPLLPQSCTLPSMVFSPWHVFKVCSYQTQGSL